MSTHTPGAINAANIIMNGRRYINTVYGKKSVDGIADLIERETAAQDLLAAAKEAQEIMKNMLDELNKHNAGGWYNLTSPTSLIAAIARAEGGMTMIQHTAKPSPGVHLTLTDAAAGYYVRYIQNPSETGLPVSTYVYVGPFDTEKQADEHDDGGCARDGVERVIGK